MTPPKSAIEQKLFERYKKWLSSDYVPTEIIELYKQDLKINKL